ncbi:MAG: hypothetical protein DSZ29_02000 [Aquificaceae bacterium]|nr:MAG: hypothetical protein DSZ29_02000 [Aquificaceae bacterium]
MINYSSENIVAEAHKHIDVINLDQADAMRQEGINIIDVREPEEYNAGAIPGAINMPRSVLEFVVGEYLEEEDRNKPHIVYCKSGGRAALAAITMKKMGYSNVHAMQQGFAHWELDGRQIENNPS